MNFLTHAFHNDLTPRICPKCSQSHPLDVASFLSHCPSADHIVQSFIHAWRPPFNQVASIWWAQCSHPGDKRNFVKFLVPSTLYDAMTTPTTGETRPQRVLAFENALPQRQRQLTDALLQALTWLAEDPPPLPRHPPQGPNTWGQPYSTYSTSHSPQAHSDYRYPLPPDHLPDSVRPPPQKKQRIHENKMPMRPKQPPTKRSMDTEDPPARKTRSDTYAPKLVAPPQPPGADRSNQQITDFFQAPAPPPPPAEPPPSVSSTPGSFSPPPHRLPYPPPAFGLFSAKRRENPLQNNEACPFQSIIQFTAFFPIHCCHVVPRHSLVV